jgi:PAS domain S-box-containing protein
MIVRLLNPDNYRLTFYALPILATGIAIAALGIYVLLRERGSRVGITFWLFTLCISLWLLATGAASASINESLSAWLIRAIQFGVVCIPTAAVTLAVSVVQRQSQYRILVRAFLALSLLFCVGIALTDLFYKGMYLYPWGYYPRYGILGAIFLFFFGFAAVLNLYIFWQEYRQSTMERHRKRLKGLLWAFSVGYLGAVDFIDTFGKPLYPFGYIPVFCFIGIASWVIVRYRLVDLTPELATGQILETMHGAVIVVDLEGRIRVVNHTAENMLGKRKTALLGNRLSSVLALPGAYSDPERIREGRIRNLELVMTRREDREIVVSLSASFVEEKKNDPLGIVYVLQDITERKRDEEKLRKYSEELMEINEELKNFTYIVSHDLRAPLVSIRGFSLELAGSLKDLNGLLQKHLSGLDPVERKQIDAIIQVDVPEAVNFIGSSVSRMDRLIKAILELSHLGRREFKPEPLDMHATVSAILDSLNHQITERRVEVAIGSLPSVTADRLAMEQVLGNLIDNALKYLDPARPGRLEIAAEPREDDIVIHIRDNGRGIAQEDIPKVFEIFKRAGTQDVPGDGMGLAYVKTLVKRHGGRIWCESELGKGSTFGFTIPKALRLS